MPAFSLPRRRNLAWLLLLAGIGLWGASATGTYQVKWGDTLWGIAAKLHVPMPAIVSANGLHNPNQLAVGSTLKVPPPSPLPAKLLADPHRLALRPTFDKWAKAYGVPSDLFQAMTWYESGWQNNKVSSTGARGIGQLEPDTIALTQRLIGHRLNPAVASDNIQMSARFLALLLKETGGHADQALAGYYQGLRSVRTVGMYTDTKQYVAGILNLRKAFAR